MKILYRVQARSLEADIDQLFIKESVAQEYRKYLIKSGRIGNWIALSPVYVPEVLSEVVQEGEDLVK